VSERLEARYPAVLETQENGALLVRFVDLEDTFTEGETLDEALFNATEVLSTMLGRWLDHDLPIPEPSPVGEGMVLIAPDARTQAALLIRRARGNRSLAELARSLQTSWPSAQRLENPHHSPTLVSRGFEPDGGALRFGLPWPPSVGAASRLLPSRYRPHAKRAPALYNSGHDCHNPQWEAQQWMACKKSAAATAPTASPT